MEKIMRPLFLAYVGIVFGSYLACPQVSTAAIDDKLGMALMSAVVANDGTLERNSGAAGAAKTAGGTYTVQFARDVTDCVYAASLGDIDTGLPPVGAALVSRSGTDSNKVFVETVNSAGSLTDASFHLIVVCGQ
jgi:hypothetical protein